MSDLDGINVIEQVKRVLDHRSLNLAHTNAGEWGIVDSWLRALVTRCEQAQAEVERWKGQGKVAFDRAIELQNDLAALKDRCATAEAAYQEAQVVEAGLRAEIDHYKRARREP